MSVKEIKSEIEALHLEDRRHLAAFLVALRHKDMAEYRSSIARKIDDTSPEHWLSLEDYDQRISS